MHAAHYPPHLAGPPALYPLPPRHVPGGCGHYWPSYGHVPTHPPPPHAAHAMPQYGAAAYGRGAPHHAAAAPPPAAHGHLQLMPPVAPVDPAKTAIAEEQPEVYQAFERMAVQVTDLGIHIILPDEMCMDRHVLDFLSCLECYFHKSLGDLRAAGRPWKLRRLDLSRNGLTDEYLTMVMTTLKRLDVRLDQLWLAGNKLQGKAVEAIVDYIWNCPEPLHELDLTDNQISTGPDANNDKELGGDVVSALLRCLYNHSCYPRTTLIGTEKRAQPFVLKMSGNLVQHPKTLLKDIQSKGGKDHVRLCREANPYTPQREFLAVYAPDFQKQRKPDDADGGVKSRTSPKSVVLRPAERPVCKGERGRGAAQPFVLTPASDCDRKRSRSRRKRKRECKESDTKDKPVMVAKPSSETKDPTSSTSLATPAPPVQEVPASPPMNPLGPSAKLPEADKEVLLKRTYQRLVEIYGPPVEGEEDKHALIAELMICMVDAHMTRAQFVSELQAFLGTEAPKLTAWLRAVLQLKYGPPKQRRHNADDRFQ